MRMNVLLTAAAGLAALFFQPAGNDAAAQTRTTFDIYVVDVEGGNATLFVPPSGESVLIDTGNLAPEAAIRDAERIMAAAKDAGLTRIDHLITTHWHGDHFGGMAELAKRIPIRHFIDHGPNIQPFAGADEFIANGYKELYSKAKHTVAKPGDSIPVAGLDWRIVTSAGEVLKTPLPGAGAPNPSCASFKPQPVDTTENAQSVGSIVTFGKFRVAHLGDLTVNKEFELMCRPGCSGTSWVGGLEFGSAGAWDSSPGGDHEQRHPQRRTARCDEDPVFLSRSRGSLADTFLAAQRAGIHRARNVHRQPPR